MTCGLQGVNSTAVLQPLINYNVAKNLEMWVGELTEPWYWRTIELSDCVQATRSNGQLDR